MGLDGRVADVELLADLGVGEASGNEAQYVELALGQVFELLLMRGLWDACEPFDYASCDRRREERLAPATMRIAARSCSAGSSLRTKPLAPARSAS